MCRMITIQKALVALVAGVLIAGAVGADDVSGCLDAPALSSRGEFRVSARLPSMGDVPADEQLAVVC